MVNQSKDESRSCDVVIVGGGPAGSTVAAMLAERGWRVAVLEKDRHPRFHIGESLLPYSMPFFDRLGVRADVERVGLKKYGSEIIAPYYGKSLIFRFSEVSGAEYTHAFQVKRAEFDAILLRNCVSKGAAVHEGVTATHAELIARDKVIVSGRSESSELRQWKARFLVDASGRDTFLARQLGYKRRNRRHNSAAVFSHFTGVRRLAGTDEGNITLCWFDRGWFWLIPLKDGVTSVGVVCPAPFFKSRKGTLDDLFWEAIHGCAPIAERLERATQVLPTQAAGNYSYSSNVVSGDGFVIVGDASAFVDPVFSSGVHLALNSATLAAAAIDSYLAGRSDYERRLRRFERQVRQGLAAFSWLIYHFNEPAFQYLLMHPRNWFGMKEAVLSIMAGNVFGARKSRFPLLLFRLFYCLTVLFTIKRALAARRLMRGNADRSYASRKSRTSGSNCQSRNQRMS